MSIHPSVGRRLNRGDVFWCDFPAPDKRRPVVLIARGEVIGYMQSLTVVPITSRIRLVPSYVPLSLEDGLLQDCCANGDGLQTVPRSSLGERITTLSEPRMVQISHAVVFALGFESALRP